MGGAQGVGKEEKGESLPLLLSVARPLAFLSPFAIQVETPGGESANGAHVNLSLLVSSREKD